jgi:hypothetical protein
MTMKENIRAPYVRISHLILIMDILIVIET